MRSIIGYIQLEACGIASRIAAIKAAVAADAGVWLELPESG